MLMECQSCRFILLADPRVAAMVLSISGLRVPASIRTRHMYGTPTTRQSDCELQFSREFRLGILLVRCTTVRLVALYAHLELADSIVNLLCVGASVTENQAASSRWVQVACGQWRCGNAPLGSLPGKRHVVNAERQHCH